MREQRRARRIAMSPEELDAFMAENRTCRVATVLADGRPHVTPLWYVWVHGTLWLHSITRAQRWADLMRNPNVAIMVDAGHDYGELRGVEIQGRALAVGEVPRAGAPNDELMDVEQAWARKYQGSDQMHYDGAHAWLKVEADKIVSWDFRKI